MAAWPLVIQQAPDARLVVAGYGEYRDALAGLVRALATATWPPRERSPAGAGNSRAGRGASCATSPPSWTGSPAPTRSATWPCPGTRCGASTSPAGSSMIQVSDLMGLSRVVVVPSTFPEAFGMVLAEAACCGSIPLSSSHSGLAEVTATLAGCRPARPAVVEPGAPAVSELAAKISGWLPALPAQPQVPAPGPAGARRTRQHALRLAEVADGIVAAAQGRLSQLEPVPDFLSLRPGLLTRPRSKTSSMI